MPDKPVVFTRDLTDSERIRDLEITLRRALLLIKNMTRVMGGDILPPMGPDPVENESIMRVLQSYKDKSDGKNYRQ